MTERSPLPELVSCARKKHNLNNAEVINRPFGHLIRSGLFQTLCSRFSPFDHLSPTDMGFGRQSAQLFECHSRLENQLITVIWAFLVEESPQFLDYIYLGCISSTNSCSRTTHGSGTLSLFEIQSATRACRGTGRSWQYYPTQGACLTLRDQRAEETEAYNDLVSGGGRPIYPISLVELVSRNPQEHRDALWPFWDYPRDNQGKKKLSACFRCLALLLDFSLLDLSLAVCDRREVCQAATSNGDWLQARSYKTYKITLCILYSFKALLALVND